MSGKTMKNCQMSFEFKKITTLLIRRYYVTIFVNAVDQ